MILAAVVLVPVDAHVVLLASVLGRDVVTSDVDHHLRRLADVLPAATRPRVHPW